MDAFGKAQARHLCCLNFHLHTIYPPIRNASLRMEPLAPESSESIESTMEADENGPWVACMLRCADPFTLEAAQEKDERGLAQLQAAQTQLPAHLTVQSAPAAPIQRISEDVFRHILIRGWADADMAERAQFTVRAASVCRSWREVVLDTSMLWSIIYVDLSEPPVRTLKRLRLFVERSREHELEIDMGVYAVETCCASESADEDADEESDEELDDEMNEGLGEELDEELIGGSVEESVEGSSGESDEKSSETSDEASHDGSRDSDESYYTTESGYGRPQASNNFAELRMNLSEWYLTAILDILLPHLKRWSTCSIELPFSGPMDSFLRSLQASADVLQEFCVVFCQSGINFIQDVPLCVCQTSPSQFRAPNLRILALCHIRLLPDLILQDLFPALRTLVLCEAVIERITVAHLLRMLQPLQHLEHLTLEDNKYQESLSADEGSVRAHLAALKTLVVISQLPADVSTLFSVFTAPNLTRFEYRNPAVYLHDLPEQAHEAPLVALRPLFFPSLETIDVHMPYCDLPLKYVSRWIHGFRNARISVNVKDVLLKPKPRGSQLLYTGLSAVLTELEHVQPHHQQLFPGLSAVTICRPRGLSVEILRSVVHALGGFGGPVPDALRELRVYTDAGLLREDREWFEHNVGVFEWAPLPEDAYPKSSLTLCVGSP